MELRGARRPRNLRLVPAPRLSGSSAFGRRAAVRVDVLHHTSDARILLREAARVSRCYIEIKDHLREGPFAKATLQAMDWIGNYGHDVVLPYNYLSEQEWREHFQDTNLSPEMDGKPWIVLISVLAGLRPTAPLYRTSNDLLVCQRTFQMTSATRCAPH